MGKRLTAGRLAAEWGGNSSDRTSVVQHHRNGSDEIVGSIELDDDEIQDMLYLLNRIQQIRLSRTPTTVFNYSP